MSEKNTSPVLAITTLLIARYNGKSGMCLNELIRSYLKELRERRKGNGIISRKRRCKTPWFRHWKYKYNVEYPYPSSRRLIVK